MNRMKQLVCPISNEKINERVVRLNALLGILLIISAFVFHSVYFIIFLMADFYVRAFTKTKYSLLSFVSRNMANALNLGNKTTDKAPKIFAARIGFLFTLVLSVLFILEFSVAAYVVGGILVFFASMEFALGICVGCFIYNYVVLPFYK